MTRDELERALHDASLPDEVAARSRARQTVLAAHAEVAPRRSRRGRMLSLTALAAAGALVAAQLSPAQPFERIWRTVVNEATP
ncbi:MAG: hypothetical protein ABW249_07815, partial [Solirubrobacterales bacterium]